MAKVIRIVVYEGDEQAVRQQIATSLGLGTKQLPQLSITVYEHSNDLPNFWGLHPDQVKETIAKGNNTDGTANHS